MFSFLLSKVWPVIYVLSGIPLCIYLIKAKRRGLLLSFHTSVSSGVIETHSNSTVSFILSPFIVSRQLLY